MFGGSLKNNWDDGSDGECDGDTDICGHDSHCKNCGRGYNFEVGLGAVVCEHCDGYLDGEPIPTYDLTDEEYTESMFDFAEGVEDTNILFGDDSIDK